MSCRRYIVVVESMDSFRSYILFVTERVEQSILYEVHRIIYSRGNYICRHMIVVGRIVGK